MEPVYFLDVEEPAPLLSVLAAPERSRDEVQVHMCAYMWYGDVPGHNVLYGDNLSYNVHEPCLYVDNAFCNASYDVVPRQYSNQYLKTSP